MTGISFSKSDFIEMDSRASEIEHLPTKHTWKMFHLHYLTGDFHLSIMLCFRGACLSIDGNKALSWSRSGPEDFILLNKYMLQGLSYTSRMIKLHP